MSKTTDKPNDLFDECRKSTEKFFTEIEKSTPIYHQTANRHTAKFPGIMEKCDFFIHYAATGIIHQAGLNVNANKETLETIRSITKQAIDAYQNQNKFTIDSNYTANNMFEAFNENTKTFASLSKNILELMSSAMKKT
jgi:hypothetical protein